MKKQLLLLFILAQIFIASAQGWTELGPGSALFTNPDDLNTVVSDAVGNIYTAGFLTDSVTGATYVNKWNGSSWSKLGGNLDTNYINDVYAMCTDHMGNVYVAGIRNYYQKSHILKWNGSSWVDLGIIPNSNGTVYVVYSLHCDAAGNLYAGGNYTDASNKNFVAKWNGSSWSSLGPINNRLGQDILTICSDPAGNVYAGGRVCRRDDAFSPYIYYVAKWDGSAWSELGSGVDSLNAVGYIRAIDSDAAGNIYATGNMANDSGYIYVAKWNGSSWSEVGAQSELGMLSPNRLFGQIYSMAVTAAGAIYVVGELRDSIISNYQVLAWNGNNWSRLGNLAADRMPHAVCTDPFNNVYTTGEFFNSSSRHYVAKFGSATGFATQQLATAALSIYPNPSPGNIIVELSDPIANSHAQLEVIDPAGQTVMATSIQTGQPVNLETIPPGLYLLRISTPQFRQTQKLVIAGR